MSFPISINHISEVHYPCDVPHGPPIKQIQTKLILLLQKSAPTYTSSSTVNVVIISDLPHLLYYMFHESRTFSVVLTAVYPINRIKTGI